MLKRINVLVIAVVVLAILATGLSSFWLIQSYQRQVNQEFLSQVIQVTEQALLRGDAQADIAAEVGAIFKRNGQPPRLTLVAPDGRVFFDNEYDSEVMDNHLYRPEINTALQTRDTVVSVRRSMTLGVDMIYMAHYSPDLDLVIRASISDAVRREEFTRLLIALAIVMGLALAVLTVLGSLALKQITQPLQELKRAALKVKQGDYQIRVGSLLDEKNEIADLTDAFNAMAGQLQTTVRDLEDRNARLDVILNSLVVPLAVVARTKDVRFLNRTAHDLFDRHLDPEAARFPLVLITHQASTEQLVEECLVSRQAVRTELTLTTVRGLVIFQVTASPIRYVNNDSAILTFIDISQARQLQRMRSEFVANVTHELRTPLTSIRGFIETLRHGAIEQPAVANRFLDIMDIEAERLHKLISDILVLSEIEELRQDQNLESFNLNALIDDVAVLLDETASARRIALVPDTDDEKLMVLANSHRIKQILINLIDNALKYIQEGGRVKVSAHRLDKRTVELCVSDNGPGIAPEHMDRLFERFYRVDAGRSRELGGTGLGLSIVKHIAQLYGGSARVESQLGRGTTFIVVLHI
jgi:two-component system phosphate regulon sensor histidine kinase PhoR